MFFFYVTGDHRDLHVLTHSYPTRRSSDLACTLDADSDGEGKDVSGVLALALICSANFNQIGTLQPRRVVAEIAQKLRDTLIRLCITFQQQDRKSTRLNSSH